MARRTSRSSRPPHCFGSTRLRHRRCTRSRGPRVARTPSVFGLRSPVSSRPSSSSTTCGREPPSATPTPRGPRDPRPRRRRARRGRSGTRSFSGASTAPWRSGTTAPAPTQPGAAHRQHRDLQLRAFGVHLPTRECRACAIAQRRSKRCARQRTSPRAGSPWKPGSTPSRARSGAHHARSPMRGGLGVRLRAGHAPLDRVLLGSSLTRRACDGRALRPSGQPR